MGWIGEFWRRVVAFVRRESLARELDAEMRLHRESRERELVATGMDREEARYAAARAFGNVTTMSERGKEAWGWRWLEDLLNDAAFGVRALRKSPGYAVTAILTLTLGIGTTTAIFSLVNTVLLKPLAYWDPSRLVQIEENHEGAINFSFANFIDLSSTRHRALERTAAYRSWTYNVSGGSEPVQEEGALISPELFDVLGVSPLLGRGFTANEQRQGSENVAILSHGLWMSQFGGNPGVCGTTIRIGNVPHVVVGVMPANFEFPQTAQLWTPLVIDNELRTNRRAHVLHVIGRLDTNATAAQAEGELRGFVQAVQEQNPGIDPGFQIAVGTLKERITAPVRPALLVLLGAVGLVLLAACANVANLLLMRNTTRMREFAVRAALGAGQGRLLRQCLAESALLGLMGACGGTLLATWCLRLVVLFGPKGVPRLDEVHSDGTLLAVAAWIAFLTALIFGSAPAVGAARIDPNEGLKEGAKGTTSVKGNRLRGALVVAEVAFALILLAGGGLLMNSFVQLVRVWPGFDERNVLTANIFLSPDRYKQEKIAPFLDRVLERVRAIPTVVSAGAVNTLPVNGGPGTDFVVEGQPEPRRGEEPTADIRVVAGDYFAAMRIPLREGRWFNGYDTATSSKALIINQTLAERYWPGQSALGKRITMLDWGPPLTGEVVGVAGNVKSEGLDSAPGNMMYWPESQFPSIFNNLVVRTTGDPAGLAAALKSAVWSVDRDQPLANIATMEEHLSRSVATRRLQTFLIGVFAVLTVSMATIGIYGVIAYSVNSRTREIGIRVALGASTVSVRNLVLREGLRWTGTGIALGLAGAVALSGLLSSLLFGVSARDPMTLGAASVALLGVAIGACYVPARRATRVDAMRILRME